MVRLVPIGCASTTNSCAFERELGKHAVYPGRSAFPRMAT